MTGKIKQAYFALGAKLRLAIILLILMTILASSIGASFAADPAISASGWTPAMGTTTSTAIPNVSVYVNATTSDLNAASVRAKIDGNSVSAELNLKGHWEYDSCGSSYWIQESAREGTIFLTSPELIDGVHEAEVTVNDMSGHSLTEKWAFIIGVPPKFTNPFPAENSSVGNITKISAVVSDPLGVDWDSIIVKLDGNIVQHKVYEQTATVTYEGAIADGTRTASIEAKDNAGNRGVKTWTFHNDSTKPFASNWSPAKGSNVSISNPQVSVYIADSSDNLNSSSLSAKIDGNIATAKLNLKGHWEYDSCSGRYWVQDSAREGTVSLTTPKFSDGMHEAEVNIADSRGNILTEKWSFMISAPPEFTVSPTAGTIQNNTVITTLITDNNAVDWNTVVMKINNNVVTPTIVPETGTVTYKGGCPNGTVNVYIEAKDTAGNLGSKTWSFTNAVSGPQFTSCYYRLDSTGRSGTVWELKDGFTITNGILWFDGNIDDVVKITSITGTLDGVPLTIQSTPPNYYDDEREDWMNNDLRHIWYKYDGVVKDGDHTLILTATNEVGVKNSITKNFTVKTSPVISNMSPIQYGITDLTPLISVDVKDSNGTIVPESIVLTVDGVTVNRNYDTTVNKVTYLSSQLSDENYHTVTVTAKDDFGLTSTETWKFYINANNYPDMKDSNVSNCTTCHPTYTTLASHPLALYDGHGHNYNSCRSCHNYISTEAGCGACHDAAHGTNTAITYNATNYDSTFPLRIKSNREMYDCIMCHQPGSNVLGHYPGVVAATKPLRNHDLPELHKHSYTDASCNKCHAQSLTKEHARAGRVDKNGETISCNTCHLSENNDVVNAIANNKKNCDACHKSPNHPELHIWNNFNAKCQDCHKNSLLNEHMDNDKTTSGKNYDCATCHDSNDIVVQNAIANKIISCNGCHKTVHTLLLADSVPPDIPKHPGFQWSDPLKASIFLGDSTMPDRYEAGMVLISNRIVGITIEDVWKYYNELPESKMTDKGWTLKFGALVPGASSFTTEYTKDGRYVTIECYNEGPEAINYGYRIKIWYR